MQSNHPDETDWHPVEIPERGSVEATADSRQRAAGRRGIWWMITIALAHNHYDKDHLEYVKAQMLELGAPKIKAVWMPEYDMYAAIEGCHRIRAAKALGSTPEIIELDYNEVCDLDVTDPALGLDLDNPGSTIAWLVDDCCRRICIDFDED